MTDLKFTGFDLGSSPAIDATSNGENASGSVANWGANANITVEVERSALGVAPERVTFTVTGWQGFQTPAPAAGEVYDARLHDIIYVADFGDQGSTYLAPENVLDAWRDRNTGFGPRVAHVYRKPGTYRVTITAYELSSDARAVWTTDIVVADPDEVFSGDQTAYVSPTGDFSTAPTGAGQFTSLQAALDVRQEQEKTRYILRAEDHGEIADIGLFHRDGLRTLGHTHIVVEGEVGAYTRPLMRPLDNAANGLFNLQGVRETTDVVIQGLHLQGYWDSTTETGDNLKNGIRFFPVGISPRNVLIDNCRIEGFSDCIVHAGDAVTNGPDAGICIHDSYFTNWRNFGFYCGGADHVEILGTAIVQSVDALSGSDRPSAGNNHGPIRLQSGTAMSCTVDGCDFFSRNGWVNNVPTYRTQQPCFRWNQAGVENAFLNFGRTAMEGGYDAISLRSANDDTAESPENMLIDKFVIVGSHMTNRGITTEVGGITIRNGLMIVPDVPRIDGLFHPLALLQTDEPEDNVPPAGLPIKIEHCTILNLMTTANAPGTDRASVKIVNASSSFTDITEAGNILHQPNLDAPETPHGDLSLSVLWPPRDKGYISSDHPVLLDQYATPADTIQAGPLVARVPSAVTGAIHDIYGYERPSTPAIGAFERIKSD